MPSVEPAVGVALGEGRADEIVEIVAADHGPAFSTTIVQHREGECGYRQGIQRVIERKITFVDPPAMIVTGFDDRPHENALERATVAL